MKQTTTTNKWDWWCSRAWILFGCGITAAVTLCILWNWERWSTSLKVVAAIAALIPIHVVEEWVFPGGFHYQYNCAMRSATPECAPMSRLSDMYTNLLTTFFYLVLAGWSAARGGVRPGVLMGTVAFSALEVTAHTVFGVSMYRRFRSKGKTTIYGAGSITAYLGFGVLGVIACYCLRGCAITAADWGICAGILACIGLGFVLLPEGIVRRTGKNRRYPFATAGYYERFLH